MAREPVTIVELDFEGCSLTWGAGACTAALGPTVPRKCFNTFATCIVPSAFATTTRTLAFVEPLAQMPRDRVYFPALKSVSVFSATVNVAGAAEDMGALGRRATVKIELQDFPYHDRETDPYQAERISGAAQYGGVGYDPAARGTFFPKLKARWPYYAGRALRVKHGYLEAGALVDLETRHFIVTDLSPPDDTGKVILEGKDVLALADNDRAVAPTPSSGVLLAGIDTAATALTLSPSGIGAQYAASGRALIGSEIVEFTRSGDAVTLTARALAGSKLAAHSAGDTFQAVLWFNDTRIDDALEILLRDYAKVPAAFIPKAAWAEEVSRWMPTVRLSTHICSPTGVAKLVGELAVLGVSIWWDDVAQLVQFRPARPTDGDTVWSLTEGANLKAVEAEERDDDRLTEVLFFSVQLDPTKSASSGENFARVMITLDADAKDARRYGDTRIKRIYCRWLDQGADGVVSSVSKRLLKRLNTAPMRARVKVDAKDRDIALGDVATVSARIFTDATGATEDRQMQVIGRSEPKPGHEVELIMQAYQFTGRYAYATENTRPTYTASTAAQKARGMYACDNVTLRMSNGDLPYQAI